MPVCPKCHKLISASHYERHLRRCGTSHKHVTQALNVPSATPQIESPNRGITYGPSSSPRAGKAMNRMVFWFIVVLAIVAGVSVLILFALFR